MSRPRIVCYGDSITQRGHDIETGGWLSVLQSKYCRSLDILTRGFSGYNTDWLLEHFEDVKVDFADAAVVFILMGANDSANDVQHVPVERFKTNLIKLAEKCQQAGAQKVVLITTPWVDGPAWMAFCQGDPESSQFNKKEPNRCEAEAEKYSKCVAEVANELKIESIPLFAEMQKQSTETRQELLCDGLHLSVSGNRMLAELVSPYLNNWEKVQCPDWKVKAKLQ